MRFRSTYRRKSYRRRTYRRRRPYRRAYRRSAYRRYRRYRPRSSYRRYRARRRGGRFEVKLGFSPEPTSGLTVNQIKYLKPSSVAFNDHYRDFANNEIKQRNLAAAMIRMPYHKRLNALTSLFKQQVYQSYALCHQEKIPATGAGGSQLVFTNTTIAVGAEILLYFLLTKQYKHAWMCAQPGARQAYIQQKRIKKLHDGMQIVDLINSRQNAINNSSSLNTTPQMTTNTNPTVGTSSRVDMDQTDDV